MRRCAREGECGRLSLGVTAGPGRLWGRGRRAGPGSRGDEGGDPASQPHSRRDRGWPAEPPSHVTTGKGLHEPRRVKRSGLSPCSNSAARPLASQGHCHTAAGAGTGSCRAGLSPSGGRRQSRSFRNRRSVCSQPPPAPGGAGWPGLRPGHSHLCLLSPGRRHRTWSPLHASMMSPHLNHNCKDLCCKQGPMLSFQVDADGGGTPLGLQHWDRGTCPAAARRRQQEGSELTARSHDPQAGRTLTGAQRRRAKGSSRSSRAGPPLPAPRRGVSPGPLREAAPPHTDGSGGCWTHAGDWDPRGQRREGPKGRHGAPRRERQAPRTHAPSTHRAGGWRSHAVGTDGRETFKTLGCTRNLSWGHTPSL